MSPALAGGFFTTSATWEAQLGVKVKVSVVQSCLTTLCDPIVYNLQGSSVRGILQARIREGIAISFSRGSF